jgi:hypothetical protein
MASDGGNYVASSMNALKHGVLSRHVVLPYEDRTEFDELLEALKAEHSPNGATELHLVEELASIFWRKRRVLIADGVKHVTKYEQEVHRSKSQILAVVAPEPAEEEGDYTVHMKAHELIELTSEEAKEALTAHQAERQSVSKAEGVLRESHDFRKAIDALDEDLRANWDERVNAGDLSEDLQGFATWLSWQRPWYRERTAALEHREEILAKAAAPSYYHQDHLESLHRYEVHLDRKLERTLAMLLKLKELRAAND